MAALKPTRLLSVIGLSMLAGSGWLLTQAYPSELGFPFAGCIHFAVIGLSGLLFWLRGGWKPWSLRSLTKIGMTGACIVVLPGAVIELTAGGISSFTSVALFCAIPTVTVIGAGKLGRNEALQGFLWPSLVGLLGALLLFPFEIPGTRRRILCFAAVAACCVVVAMASVWMHELLCGIGVGQAVAAVGIVGALALGSYGMTRGWPKISPSVLTGEVARCAVLDLPVVWLTLWLTREVNPVRLSARFLIAPLATAAEGYAIERGPLDAVKTLALALMAAGAAMLLLKDEAEEVPGLKLR